jgi:hypothetical protein
MKRRNEDDVGPVENGIVQVLPSITPTARGCGELVDKSTASSGLKEKHIVLSSL